MENEIKYDMIRLIMIKKEANHLELELEEQMFLTQHWRDFPISFI